MSDCSVTVSESSKKWPEGIRSVKLTMNPSLLSLAEEAAAQNGMKLWEYINVALILHGIQPAGTVGAKLHKIQIMEKSRTKL